MKRFTLFVLLLCLVALRSTAQCTVSAYFNFYNTGNAYFFQDFSGGTDNSTTYLWDFGDGQTSTDINPSHTYAAVGNYNVCETVTNTDIADCSNQYCYPISTCSIVPSFGYASTSLYTYTFTDSSMGEDTTTTFFWHFGDDSASTDQNPTHTFDSVGSYYVCLDLYSTALGCSTEVCNTVAITCPAVADYTYTNSSVYDYSFADASTGEDGSSTWLWDFGDGNTSTSQNPQHTFATVGNYTVCLTVTNVDQNCNNQVCYGIDIECPAQASFSETTSGLYAYSFVNTSTGADNSATYSWDFGDGHTSAAQNPSHTFDTLGTYYVCLTVNDPNLNCSSQYCSYVDISCPGSALYSYQIDTNGLTYNFSDNSTGEDGATTFLWDFGDGHTSTAQNPTHTFASADSFNVCLTVDNVTLGCVNQFCYQIAVCAVITNFTYTNTNIYTYQFTDASTGEGNGDTYLWDFGDGDTSYAKNPQHVFAGQGGYNVCLTVTSTSAGCSNTYCNYVFISCPAQASYVYSTDTTGYIYYFTDASSGEDTGTTYSWDFGNGHTSNLKNPTETFATAGSYNVCLTINDVDEDCSNQYCATLNVCPVVTYFTYTTSNTYIYHFSDASDGENATVQYAWDFGDGYTSIQKNPSHQFAAFGSYYVCLTVTDTDVNCSNQYCAAININCPVSANYTFTDSAIYTISFTDASSGEDTSSTYYWDFGDGNNSTAQNPVHTYASTGNFTACLTITDVDLNCSGNYCLGVSICPSQANFGYASTSLYNYQFSDSSTGESGTTRLTWNFGDGQSSGLQNPQHTYVAAGTYYVCLTVTDTILNCYTQYCTAVAVACPDTANFTYYPIDGWVYNFADISSGEDSTTTFTWSFGDGGTSTDQFPTHQFYSAGFYSVCLTIVNNDLACTSQFCSNVAIACVDTAAFSYTSNGFTFTLLDNSVGEDDSVSYLWEFGDGVTSNLQNPVHSYTAPNPAYRICLVLDNTDQQCSNTYCTNIDLVCPDTGTNFTYSILDSAFTFIDQSINEIDSVSYTWSFGDGHTSTVKQPTHVYGAVGKYEVCMTINQRSIGCSSEFCDTIQAVIAGISQEITNDMIKLYPNPTSGKVNIEMKDLIASEIRIFNNLGQEVEYLSPQKSGIIPVDVSRLAAGIYNVRIAVAGGAIANIKMVISY